MDSDKTRFAYDGLNQTTIDRFYLRKSDGKLEESSEETILKILRSKFLETNKDKIFLFVEIF